MVAKSVTKCKEVLILNVSATFITVGDLQFFFYSDLRASSLVP